MMGIHKITAGSGYTYLTSQTAAHDTTLVPGQELADYYSEKGEKPGRWMGRGLAGLADIGADYAIEAGHGVAEDQMIALFGEGRHPNADRIERDMIREGYSTKKLMSATKMGRKFSDAPEEKSAFQIETAKAYQAWLKDNGRSSKDPVPPQVRAAIRTAVGRSTFEDEHGRAPDERELNTHIARSTRPNRQTVAGYDLTFSPVKSASVLWALGDRDVADAVADAHDAAVAATLEWLEDEVAYTRRGTDGVRHVKTNGLIAAAFVHRDSRAGEPDLHTHVAISNKVQDAQDGKWLALDGQVLYKATVAASERYNTALERELNRRLGVDFTARTTARGRRPVREIAGIPPEWIEHFSSRRAQIEARTGQLQAQFRVDHGRPPTPKESLDLYQQATLETRAAKKEPRSEAEQRAAWKASMYALEGSDIDRVEGRLSALLQHGAARTNTLNGEQITDLAGQVLATVSASRARFQVDHLMAETLRRVRAFDLAADIEDDTVTRVVAACQARDSVVRLDAKDTVAEPVSVRRADGESIYERPRSRVYTTVQTLTAEQRVIDASHLSTTHVVADEDVAAALLASVANGTSLNPAQTQLVTEMATSGKFTQLALAPAGSGKTTSMRVLAAAWEAAHPRSEGRLPGGGVLGLAPTAVASKELGASINARSDTLSKLIWHLEHPEHDEPEWMREVGAGTMIVLDEAGMASTRDLAKLVTFARSRDAVVRLIGDDQQLASVASGGVLRDIAADAGAITLSELVRFRDPGEAAATLALREGNAMAIGFYLDHDRARVASEGDLEASVYAEWKQAHEAGESALMLAFSNDTVDALNERARADKIAAGIVDTSIEASLHDGIRAGVGDVIVTRENNRDLPLSLTDFVKNGDRWQVAAIGEDGSVRACHERLGTIVTLPADYVASSVDLGYASTIHGAQGQTVHSSFVLIRGEETRQLLYVALSRGTHMNRVFVPAGTSGDAHEVLHEDRVMPAVVTETLERVLARDGAQVSATTERRESHDPRRVLQRNAERYADAVTLAASLTLGRERMEELREQAEQLVPGISDAPSWDTLAGNLAMLEVNDADAIDQLRQAVNAREMSSARDVAGVLDWRLDPDGAHSGGQGPLGWTPAIPVALGEGEYAAWLRERASACEASLAAMRAIVDGWDEDTVPAWARHIYTERPAMTAAVLAWRAAHDVPDDETSPTGAAHPNARQRRYQRDLTARVEAAGGGAIRHGQAFRDLITTSAPEVLDDVFWPVLARRLDAALAARLPVHEHLREAIASAPLPVEYAAAALWYRLADTLEPAAATAATKGSGASRLRPAWTAALREQLPADVAARVMADAHWPSLVAAIHRTSDTTGLSADDVLTRALDLLGRDNLPLGRAHATPHTDTDTDAGADAGVVPRLEVDALATILALRVSDLRAEAPAPEQVITDADLLDDDIDAFLRDLAAERGDADAPPARPATNASPDAAVADVPVYVPTDADAPPDDEVPPDPALEAPAPSGVEEPATGTPVARLVELNLAAADFYEAAYDGSASQAYLRRRFGTDLAESTFRVGHAGPEREALVTHLHTTHDASEDELVDAGLAKWRHGRLEDVFRNRALIAIHDSDGVLVGFNGRDLSGSHPAKYLNTPATAIFTKGALLVGLFEGREHAARVGGPDRPDIVGVEGPMDAIAVTLAGGGDVIGVAAGTGGFTPAQVDQLAAYAARTDAGTLWLSKDNDRAGRAALAKDTGAFAERGLTARALPAPGGKDFAEAFQADADAARAALALREHAPVAARFVTMDIADELDLEGADMLTRVAGLRQVSTIIAQLPAQHWEREIDEAATLFAARDDTDAHEHYAAMLYQNVLVHAMHWDHETARPGAERSDLDAATDLNRIHDLLTAHNHTEPSDRMSNAIRALRENAASRSPQPSRRPRREAPASNRPATREADHRDDARERRREGPTM